MRYAGIIKNDIAGGPGVCVSFFVQGCPIKCPGCQNLQTWAFEGGKEFTQQTINDIFTAINANGIQRNLNIMGGEPLCDENLFLTQLIISLIREKYPFIKIYLWTGYIYENLRNKKNNKIDYILNNIDYLIDGPFILEERDITLPMRGSRNQRVLNMKELQENWNIRQPTTQELLQT